MFFAHDEEEKCGLGDIVKIKDCLPMTKKKHFVVEEIIHSAPRCVPGSTEAPQQQELQ